MDTIKDRSGPRLRSPALRQDSNESREMTRSFATIVRDALIEPWSWRGKRCDRKSIRHF